MKTCKCYCRQRDSYENYSEKNGLSSYLILTTCSKEPLLIIVLTVFIIHPVSSHKSESRTWIYDRSYDQTRPIQKTAPPGLKKLLEHGFTLPVPRCCPNQIVNKIPLEYQKLFYSQCWRPYVQGQSVCRPPSFCELFSWACRWWSSGACTWPHCMCECCYLLCVSFQKLCQQGQVSNNTVHLSQ